MVYIECISIGFASLCICEVCLLCNRLIVANASSFPNPTELTLKPLPAVNKMSSTRSEAASAGVSQNWTNSLPTNNGLHHAATKKSVTFSSVSINPKENSLPNAGDPVITNLSSLPTLPSLNKTASSTVHINNSNTVVKLGEEVKASLLNHHTTTQSLNSVSLQNVSSIASPSQHGTVLITKQDGNVLPAKVTCTDQATKPTMSLATQQAVSNLISVALTAAMSLPVSTRTIASAPSLLSVVSSTSPATSIGQVSTINDPNGLLGKRPKQSVIKTEEGTQAQQTTMPVLVSGCFIVHIIAVKH